MSRNDGIITKNLNEDVPAMSVATGTIAGVTDNETIVKSTKYKLKNLKHKLEKLKNDTLYK